VPARSPTFPAGLHQLAANPPAVIRTATMPELLAFCDDCGSLKPSGVFVNNIEKLTLDSNTAGPCTVCGGSTSIPDGVYRVIDHSVELIAGTADSLAKLKRLVTFLHETQEGSLNKAAVSEELRSIDPSFVSLSKWLPDSPTALFTLLTLVVSVIYNTLNLRLSYHQLELQEKQSIKTSAIQESIRTSRQEIGDLYQRIQKLEDALTEKPDSLQAGK